MIRIDVPDLMRAARKAFPDAAYVDLVGILDEETSAVLTGALDTAEQREYAFPPDRPPNWLRLETRLAI